MQGLITNCYSCNCPIRLAKAGWLIFCEPEHFARPHLCHLQWLVELVQQMAAFVVTLISTLFLWIVPLLHTRGIFRHDLWHQRDNHVNLDNRSGLLLDHSRPQAAN